ncbi:helix-turn-helix domain-containing protein [Dactylosporangium sp. NPDC000555]|uniref:TetR/AcrR family transcriptional regulator n=1 Tax=Dactylosporangium sp. NPDC000555 TaxID=3154260 RepID=UPI00332E3850
MGEAVRADARRNYELVLAAAREAFAEHGTEASLRDVARRAGVGIGTLYRHFPTREALLEALMRDGFDRLREEAVQLYSAADARSALVEWLGRMASGSSEYRGLPESVLAALHDEGSPLHESCAAMRAAGARLLERAQAAGEVRADVTPNELIALAGGVAWASERSVERSGDGSKEGPALLRRLLALAVEGISPR